MPSKLTRRQAGRSLAGAALAAPGRAAAKGNKWSAQGIRLGVSHQRPAMLSDAHFAYLKQMGVEYLEVRIPAAEASLENLTGIKRKIEGAGLKLFEIMLSDLYTSPEFTLGLPGRDRAIATFQEFLRNLGRAGIDATTYAWHTAAVYQTGNTTTRGCRTRLFIEREALARPNKYERVYTADEMWANFEYFIRRVLPVAEEAGVRLQLHPNDPPVDHAGVACIFSSRQAFRRAMEISRHSPYSGLLFCTGCWGEMKGPDGRGEDVAGALYEFASAGHVFQVHFRNVSGPLPDFHETFPDDGYLNMYKVMKALGQANFNGMAVPDHVPRCGEAPGDARTGEAYIFGYIRALIQAVNTELQI